MQEKLKGVIVLNKPKGKTSHNMVSLMRRLTGIKKTGHTGTLDPMATGVLPICIGKATKAADYISVRDKRYTACLTLGSATDTYDSSGRVLETRKINVTEPQIINTISSFVGEIYQKPPMYSAIKIGGRKLYQLARKGIEVERKSRKISIYSIDILEVDLVINTVLIDVFCSKGTYIRSLCADIGEKLGCLAYMSSLVRTKSGNFNIEDSYTPQQLEQLNEQGSLKEAVISLDEIFSDYLPIYLNREEEIKVKNGIKIKYEGLIEGNSYRIYDSLNSLLCISKAKDNKLFMDKSFWD